MESPDPKADGNGEPWGVLVLRIWAGEGLSVRGHLSQTTRLDGSTYAIGIAEGVDQITNTVRAWLLELVGADPRRRDGDATNR